MEVRQREDARNNYVRGLQHEGCSTWVAARGLQHESCSMKLTHLSLRIFSSGVLGRLNRAVSRSVKGTFSPADDELDDLPIGQAVSFVLMGILFFS